MFRYPYQMHECPVCGRPLEVRDEYVGQRVTCPHCQGQFVARQATMRVVGRTSEPETLLGKADRLLQMSARRLLIDRRVTTQPTT